MLGDAVRDRNVQFAVMTCLDGLAGVDVVDAVRDSVRDEPKDGPNDVGVDLRALEAKNLHGDLLDGEVKLLSDLEEDVGREGL